MAPKLYCLSMIPSGSCFPCVLATRGGKNPEHSSGSISSLLVGDEGGIVIVVVLDGLVDLDVVFRLRNDGLDLAGVLLGVGFLERHQLFSLDGLRSGFVHRGRT